MTSLESSLPVGLGDTLPDFELTDLDGNRWRNEDLTGRASVLFYFSSW